MTRGGVKHDEVHGEQGAAFAAQSRSAGGRARAGRVVPACDSLTNAFNVIRDTAKMKANGKAGLAQANRLAIVAQCRDELETPHRGLVHREGSREERRDCHVQRQARRAAVTIALANDVVILVLIGVSPMRYRPIERSRAHVPRMRSEAACPGEAGGSVEFNQHPLVNEIGKAPRRYRLRPLLRSNINPGAAGLATIFRGMSIECETPCIVHDHRIDGEVFGLQGSSAGFDEYAQAVSEPVEAGIWIGFERRGKANEPGKEAGGG